MSFQTEASLDALRRVPVFLHPLELLYQSLLIVGILLQLVQYL